MEYTLGVLHNDFKDLRLLTTNKVLQGCFCHWGLPFQAFRTILLPRAGEAGRGGGNEADEAREIIRSITLRVLPGLIGAGIFTLMNNTNNLCDLTVTRYQHSLAPAVHFVNTAAPLERFTAVNWTWRELVWAYPRLPNLQHFRAWQTTMIVPTLEPIRLQPQLISLVVNFKASSILCVQEWRRLLTSCPNLRKLHLQIEGDPELNMLREIVPLEPQLEVLNIVAKGGYSYQLELSTSNSADRPYVYRLEIEHRNWKAISYPSTGPVSLRKVLALLEVFQGFIQQDLDTQALVDTLPHFPPIGFIILW